MPLAQVWIHTQLMFINVTYAIGSSVNSYPINVY
jgi:hypothetical protein